MKRVCPPIARTLMPVERDFVLTVDGEPIDEHGLWLERSSLEIGEASPTLSHLTAPGFNGSYDVTLRDSEGRAFIGSRTIEFTLFTVGALDEIRESKRWLGGLHGMKVKVSWRVQKGWFEGTLAVGAWKDVWEGSGLTIASVKCAVTCADPFMYADNPVTTPLKEVSTDGQFRFYKAEAELFYGNREFYPSELEVDVDTATEVSVHYSDSKPDIKVLVNGDFTGVKLKFDLNAHTVQGSGGFLTPTLDSTFFPVRPGDTSKSVYVLVKGTLQSTLGHITYTPRWLF